MSGKDNKSFAVVEFEGEGKSDKKIVELIPISWLKNETSCFWPPRCYEKHIQQWIKDELTASDNWDVYPVKIISKAKNYEQGLRRLERSYTQNDVETTETESTTGDHTEKLDPQNVAKQLASVKTLKNFGSKSCSGESIDSIEIQEIGDDTTIPDPSIPQKENDNDEIKHSTSQQNKIKENFTNLNDVASYLKSVIEKEMEKTRRNLNHAITERYSQYLKAVQYSTNNPSNYHQVWKTVGEGLPNATIDEFLEFENSLKNNEDKTNALMEIFKMVTAGSMKYEDDVAVIIGKIIKKDVQMQYSGCGKRTKGIGKKSFKDTETFKVMDKFLMAKYANATGKVSTVTAVSRFLSGAKDRDGGRAHRNEK